MIYLKLQQELKKFTRNSVIRSTIFILLSIVCIQGSLFASGESESPELAIRPIENFQLEKYLGTWYEIARLDHSFERGLSRVTANYSLKEDGGVVVKNNGFNAKKQKWNEAIGKAYLVENQALGENLGLLKVSFFGPFYAPYIIFELGENYDYAFIGSTKSSFLWFLSRNSTVDENLKSHFLDTVSALGYNTDELIFVEQTQ